MFKIEKYSLPSEKYGRRHADDLSVGERYSRRQMLDSQGRGSRGYQKALSAAYGYACKARDRTHKRKNLSM